MRAWWEEKLLLGLAPYGGRLQSLVLDGFAASRIAQSSLAEGLGKLGKLSLEECNSMPEEGVRTLFARLRDLSELTISALNFSSFKLESNALVSQHRLQKLDLVGVEISPDLLSIVAQSCPTLSSLRISAPHGAQEVTKIDLAHLRPLVSLERLDLCNFDLVSSQPQIVFASSKSLVLSHFDVADLRTPGEPVDLSPSFASDSVSARRSDGVLKLITDARFPTLVKLGLHFNVEFGTLCTLISCVPVFATLESDMEPS